MKPPVFIIWYQGHKPVSTASLLASGDKALWPTPIWASSGAGAPRIANVGTDCGSARETHRRRRFIMRRPIQHDWLDNRVITRSTEQSGISLLTSASLYCCWPLPLTFFSSACLSLDCSLYCHKKKWQKESPRDVPRKDALWGSWYCYHVQLNRLHSWGKVYFYLRAVIIFARPVKKAIFAIGITANAYSGMKAKKQSGSGSPDVVVIILGAGNSIACCRIWW